MNEYILSVGLEDAGARAVLIGRDGSAAGSRLISLSKIRHGAGHIEYDPVELLFAAYRAMAGVMRDSGIDAASVVGVGITNRRGTALAWDRRTGKPVCNAISWKCERTEPICGRLMSEGSEISRITGLYPHHGLAGPKLSWILGNVPGVHEMANNGWLLLGTLDSWLIWNLTGGKHHLTDVTNASGTMLFNTREMRWDDGMCEILGVPLSALPHVMPSLTPPHRVSDSIPGIEELGGIPICSVIADQQAALFGHLCLKPGDAKNTYGDGCFLLVNTGGRRVEPGNGMLSTVAWDIGSGPVYAAEGAAFRAGDAADWLEELGLIGGREECIELAGNVPDSGGVYFVPASSCPGSPHRSMDDLGALLGLTRSTGRAHIARAALESLAYQVADLAASVSLGTGLPITKLRVDGDESSSDALMRFQAKLLGVPVVRPPYSPASSTGAAYIAGLVCGFWSGEEDLKNLPSTLSGDVFNPRPGEDGRDILLRNWREAVRRT